MKYAYWLSSLYTISDRKKRDVLRRLGNARTLYETSGEKLEKLGCFRPEEIRSIEESRHCFCLDEEWERFRKKEIFFLTEEDRRYPSRLKHLYDPPYALFVKGRLPKEDVPSVAIVGARGCSEYGRSVARVLGRTLATHKAQVISGMALGVDSAAHAGAMAEKGDTFAVLGCGCDICYPRSSKNIYENIHAGEGGIISEFFPGTKPLPVVFPRRNRIISGLADVVVVVEAREKSGSLITADHALEQGKDVYAVPGRFGEPLSRGCNRLIEQGAGILYDVDNFLTNIGIVKQQKKKTRDFNNLALAKEEGVVYSVLGSNPMFINLIVAETNLDLLTVLAALDQLKKKKLVQETFQNYFCKIL